MATKVDLRNKILKELGVLPVGQVASAEDAVDVEAKIDEIHAEYTESGIASWDIDSTPDNVVDPYVKIIAHYLSATFSVSQAKAAKLERNFADARRRLYQQTSFKNVAEPTKAVYY